MGSGRNILIVGTNRQLIEMAREAFAHLGHQVVPASGVALGIYLAHKNFPHLVLCTADTVDADGLDFVRSLKADSQLAHIPVLFFYGQESLERQAIEAGSERAVPLPASADALILAAAPYLCLDQADREADTPE